MQDQVTDEGDAKIFHEEKLTKGVKNHNILLRCIVETIVIDTIVKNNLIRLPAIFNNKRIKAIITEAEEENKTRGKTIKTRQLNFKIDDSLEDVTPFADIADSRLFVEKLRENHWQ